MNWNFWKKKKTPSPLSTDAAATKKVAPNRTADQRKVRNVHIAHDAVFYNLTHRELADKYGLSLDAMKKIRARPEIKELEEMWTANMFTVQRDMGAAALAATMKLIMEGDAGTIKDYWKRMGVSKEPAVEVEIQELKFQVPDAMKPIMEMIAKETKQIRGNEEKDANSDE